MIADLSALAAAVAQRAGNSDLVYVMAPRQAVAAVLGTPKEFPYPLLTSTALADGEVICVVPVGDRRGDGGAAADRCLDSDVDPQGDECAADREG